MKRIICQFLTLLLFFTVPPYEASAATIENSGITSDQIVAEARSWATKRVNGKTIYNAVYFSEGGTSESVARRTGYNAYVGRDDLSFDCSGFVCRVLNDVGLRVSGSNKNEGTFNEVLYNTYGPDHISSNAQGYICYYGEDVSEELQKAKNGNPDDYLNPGDLLGWKGGSVQFPNSDNHIAIYAGNGKIVHFTGNGYKDEVASSAYWASFKYARRLAPLHPYLGNCPYSSSCNDIVEITKNPTYLKSLPCSINTHPDSVVVDDTPALPLGTKLQTSRLYLNTEGNYWYKATIIDGPYSGKSGYIYKDDTKVVPHVHDKGTYVYFGKTHPHHNYYRCSICGEEYPDESSSNYYSSCEICNPTYTINFNPSGGTGAQASMTVKKNQSIGSMPTPVLSNYNFAGWYTAPTGGSQVYSSTVPTGDMTLYAHWTHGSRAKLTYNLNGGNLNIDKISYPINGFDIGRETDYLVIYKNRNPNTNYYGAEIAVNSQGQLTAYRAYESSSQLSIPSGGVVVSGHGKAGSFVSQIYYNGYQYVYVDYEQETVTAYKNRNCFLADTKYLQSGDSYGELPVPTREGYTFDGWTVDGYHVNSESQYRGNNLAASWQTASGTWGNLSWDLDNTGLLTITGNGNMNGFDHDSTEAWNAYKDRITSVKIENGITSIGEYAFAFCENLKSVSIPSSVTCISGGAFEVCSGLETVTIPSSVTVIGWYAFSNCSSLKTVVIPSSVEILGNSAFRSCNKLQSLTISEGVTAMEEYVFCGCSSLMSVTIPSSISKIGGGAFESCESLLSATISEGVKEIGEYAFYHCRNLTDIAIPNSVTSIGSGAFNNTNVQSVLIPYGVVNLGDWVFAYCPNLESITLPESVTSIGTWFINDCPKLISITIPSQVTCIPKGTFTNCTGLCSIVLPADLVEIGEQAFDNCPSLTDVYYGASSAEWQAISIGTRNDGLNSATIHSADGTWGNLNWSLNKNGHLTISGNGAMDGFSHDSTDAWNTYRSKITSAELKNGITSIGWNAFFSCENLKSVTIPSSVTTIGNYAFSNCSSLNTVLIPSTVATLGNSAFRSCSKLQNLTISEGVTVMEEYVFCGCSSLTSVTIPSSISKIGGGAFEDCGSLTNVVICEGVKEIGEFAFSRSTNLSIVSIPGSVTNIERYAFNNTALKTVCFDGTQEQWTEISVGEGNDSLASAEKQYGKYTVAYDANGGINAPSEQIMARGTNLTISSTEPTRSSTDSGYFTVTLSANGGNVSTTSLTALRTTSYNFKNWNTEAEGYGTSYEAGGIYSDNTSVTLYAQWNSDTTTKEVHLPIPTRDGYSFLGWSTSSDSTEGISGSYYTPDSDITLYALWEENAPRTGTWGSLSWTLDSMGQLTISGSGEMDGFSSGSIEAWRAFRDDIKTITIMPGVTSIGHYAFYNCLNLLEITIPSGVECIGNAAIAYCARLDSIIIPDSVNSIGYSAFAGCGHLGSIVLPEGITSIENCTFSRCSYLSRVTLPESITSIGNAAFQYCNCIKEITIPQRVSIISDSMFNGCSRLSTITIPQNVNTIGRSAFKGCEGLTDIYFGGTQVQWNKIKKLPDNEPLLNATVHFTIPDPDFILPTALTTIEEEAFASSGFVYAKLPEQVISIGWHAFADCPNLAYIYIPSLTTQIDEEAFGDLQGLTILGKTGSTSETYAQNHNFNFIPIP